MDEASFQKALQELKIQVDGVIQKQHYYVQNQHINRDFVHHPLPQTQSLDTPSFQSWRASEAFEHLESRVTQLEERFAKSDDERSSHGSVQFTPASSVASGISVADYAAAHGSASCSNQPQADTSPADAPNASPRKIKPAARLEDIGCFHPELSEDLTNLSKRNMHYFTANVTLFVSKLKHAARTKQIDHIARFLHGSALRWYDLGFSDTGLHYLDNRDGEVDIGRFCDEILIAFGDDIGPGMWWAENSFTGEDARNGRDFFVHYALPQLEQTLQASGGCFAGTEALLSHTRTCVETGIDCYLEEKIWEILTYNCTTFSQYVQVLRIVAAMIKNRRTGLDSRNTQPQTRYPRQNSPLADNGLSDEKQVPSDVESVSLRASYEQPLWWRVEIARLREEVRVVKDARNETQQRLDDAKSENDKWRQRMKEIDSREEALERREDDLHAKALRARVELNSRTLALEVRERAAKAVSLERAESSYGEQRQLPSLKDADVFDAPHSAHSVHHATRYGQEWQLVNPRYEEREPTPQEVQSAEDDYVRKLRTEEDRRRSVARRDDRPAFTQLHDHSERQRPFDEPHLRRVVSQPLSRPRANNVWSADPPRAFSYVTAPDPTQASIDAPSTSRSSGLNTRQVQATSQQDVRRETESHSRRHEPARRQQLHSFAETEDEG